MKETNIKKSAIGTKELMMILFLVVTVGLIFMFDPIVSFFNNSASQVEESRETTKEISDLLIQIDQISFDTSILSSAYFQTLNSIPMFQIDVSSGAYGKINPFTGTIQATSQVGATSTVGGVVQSSQRQNGQSGVTGVQINSSQGTR